MLEPDPRNRPTAAQCLELLSGSWTGGSRQLARDVPAGTSHWPANGTGQTASSWPNGPVPPQQVTAPPVTWRPESARGTGPGRKRRKGKVIAALAGVAVLLIAGAYVARGVIFGSEAGHSPAADGGATPGASAPAVARNTTVPASATDASGAIAGSSAAAAGTATLTGVTTQVDVGSAPSFTYTAQDVPSGDSVVLQRTFGQTYEDVTTLSGANGPVTAPALDTTGKYSFRVAIEGGGSVLSASDPVTVAAYSDVPLQPLHTGGGGTVQAGNRLFSYTDYVSTDYYPNYYQHQAWTSSTCRSITVQFTGSTGAQGSGRTAYLEFVQTSKDPVYTSAPAGTVKSVTVALDGGPLYINGSVATSGFDIDITATGSCYTTTGQLDS